MTDATSILNELSDTLAPVDFAWQPSDAETYEYRLGAVWPACNMRRRDMFLLGEAYDHEGDTTNPNAPRYLAHMQAADGTYWIGSRPVTVAEFMRLDRR